MAKSPKKKKIRVLSKDEPKSAKAKLGSPKDLPFLERLFRGEDMPFGPGAGILAGRGATSTAVSKANSALRSFVKKAAKKKPPKKKD
jgi:hypothetical protein